jgi:hypothetical protein
VTLTNAWPAIQELFEDQYVRLEGAHKGMAPKALSQLWAAQVQEVCQLLLAARDSIDLDIGGEGGPPAELLKFCEQQCFMHKSLEQMQAKAAKRVKQQKGKGGTAAAGGSSSDKEEGVPAALREVDGKMENLARLLFKMSELVYIEEDEMTFKRVRPGCRSVWVQNIAVISLFLGVCQDAPVMCACVNLLVGAWQAAGHRRVNDNL